MLIALEIAGFKSFAEKTRFDFPEGITVVIGPNGSGKSNVVDAIKWVLGAQSAKALRGQEMSDVIFKGSSGSGRKPANSAEATLVFDNRSGTLPIETEQVQITRRVYRSGESEYLINNQEARLKDIKNLFRGTGVGVDAYSIIEQGKVDRLLQASPKDRRVIFEEAAGISRFNAKKLEAERRMLRVDQNMLRLKDIVDEIRTRLNSLKNQAGKAQKYREMTQRLHEIRLRLGWTEYCESSQRQAQTEFQVAEIIQQQTIRQSELQEAQSLAQNAERELHQVAQQIQLAETAVQDAEQRIAVSTSRQQSLEHRVTETGEEQNRQVQRLEILRQRASELAVELESLRQAASAANQSHTDAQQLTATIQSEVRTLTDEINSLVHRHESLRTEHVRLWREATEKSSTITQLRSSFDEISAAVLQGESVLDELRLSEQATRQLAMRTANRLTEAHQQYQQATADLDSARMRLDENRLLLSKLQEEAGLLQGRLEGATERLEILDELQQHLEGVDAGARFILNLKANDSDPVYGSVYGLVADLIQVDVMLAPLIDTALGTAANAIVLRDGQLIQHACAGKLQVPGRLTLMRLDRIPQSRFGEKVQLESVTGVIGRADRLIKCRREVLPLVRYLLGTTWLVENMEVALELGHFRGAGLRFVTAECQLIEADGSVTLGALTTSSGLVSRSSEIRHARDEIAQFRDRYQKLQGEIERIHGRVVELNPNVDQLEQLVKQLAQEFAHQQAAAHSSAAKLDELEKQLGSQQGQLSELVERRRNTQPKIDAAELELRELQSQIDILEVELGSHEQVLRERQEKLSAASESQVATKVNLARTEQIRHSALVSLEQGQRTFDERQKAVEEVELELQRLDARKAQAEIDIRVLCEELNFDRQQSEQEQAKLDALIESAKGLRERRSATTKQLDAVARIVDRLAQQLELNQSELQRHRDACSGLLSRYEEDYHIELAMLQVAEPVDDVQQREKMSAEAARLRHDISSVGEINMAALTELDELQQRYDHLNGQYEDLLAAKESLQRIIQKINGDSRRLFLETLEIIRQNFQKLYRKSFGGGHADIVLEEGLDVLECGIDIIATPPGKTSFSNSLLSGGEKALTAVALLLAIFQYRPSPFCVLDEVDAPFDEANIGRFVNVLTEFLDWTKFIIVTHSKKTMTAATTLYGVTMQESGVSKQVAVRFEDVNEKGEIGSKPHSNRQAA